MKYPLKQASNKEDKTTCKPLEETKDSLNSLTDKNNESITDEDGWINKWY